MILITGTKACIFDKRNWRYREIRTFVNIMIKRRTRFVKSINRDSRNSRRKTRNRIIGVS